MNPSHILQHFIPSIKGIANGNASKALIKERLRFMFRRKTRPILERGFPLYDIQSIIAWWEIVVENRLLPAVPFVPSRILDIGANQGIFGYACKMKWPKAAVDAVEPHPQWFQKAKNIGVYSSTWNCALGADSNPSLLYIVNNEGATATTNPDLYPVRPNPIEVQCRQLDSMGLNQYDLIKIDVDGAEMCVLAGGMVTLREAKAVLVEINDKQALESYQAAFPSPQWQQKKLTTLDWIFIRNQ